LTKREVSTGIPKFKADTRFEYFSSQVTDWQWVGDLWTGDIKHRSEYYLKEINLQPHVVERFDVDVPLQDLLLEIQISENRPELLIVAEQTLEMVKGVCRPAAVYNWFSFEKANSGRAGYLLQNATKRQEINFGKSIQFLEHTSHALVAVYTVGKKFEQESKKASARGDFLVAYFFDIIGLIILRRAEQTIKEIAEKQAQEYGWGVSPFLSPGSVHGWELQEQEKLCSLLPLEKIGVEIHNNGVLLPFSTVSCLIGIGPGYEATKVGIACQVCSKKHTCQMRKSDN